MQHLPLWAVHTGQVGTVATFRAPAGVVLEDEGVLTQAALVAGLVAIGHQLTPTGITTGDGAAWLDLLQGACMG